MSRGQGAAIAIAPDDAAVGYKAYGGAAELWQYKGHEAVLAGSFETGKTLACLHKLNALLCKYPRSRALMVRKTYKSLKQSVVVTFDNHVLAYPPSDSRCPVHKVGGNAPSHYEYPNGSVLVLGGMDNPQSLLSSEWDFIYIPQLEELSLSEYEALVGRCTGRANNAPYPQVIGDCNPGPPSHWILHRASLKFIASRHEDNPTLYSRNADGTVGELTPRGRRTMAVLDSLTGVYLLRNRHGKWVAAEGQVYEDFSRDHHLVDRWEPEPSMRRIWVVDFGYNDPFVWQDWVIDHDGRAVMYQEIYWTRRTVEEHAANIKAAAPGVRPEIIICDHDMEDRATLEKHLGMSTTAAYKAIVPGIQAVQSRMKLSGDGKPRLMYMRDALVERDEALAAARKPVCTVDEEEVYVWPKSQDGKPMKEIPVDLNNHGQDAKRYMVAYLDDIKNAAPDSSHLVTDPLLERDNRPGLTLAEMEW